MRTPDPRTTSFAAAPPGFLRVVAWRQRTPTWPHPDLPVLHAERSQLLHHWAAANKLEVHDWGATDADRPAEFVELLLDLGQATLTTGLGVLVTECVKAYFERRKAKTEQTARQPSEEQPPGGDGPDTNPTPTPLFAVTIVNESGGTIVVMSPVRAKAVDQLIAQALDPKWSGAATH